MRLVVIAVGKIKEPGLRDLIDEYYARIRRHIACDEIELREGRHVAEALRASIPAGAHVIALEVDGQSLSSEQLSAYVVERGREGKGIVAFLIGGADGLPQSVSKQAGLRLSLSRMTFAHRMARVVLAEQLYRVVSIWRGEPYHR